jgi:hypothetical protein
VTHAIALAAESYTKINLKFPIYCPWCRAARAEYLIVPKKQLRASFPVEHFCGVRDNCRVHLSRLDAKLGQFEGRDPMGQKGRALHSSLLLPHVALWRRGMVSVSATL